MWVVSLKRWPHINQGQNSACMPLEGWNCKMKIDSCHLATPLCFPHEHLDVTEQLKWNWAVMARARQDHLAATWWPCSNRVTLQWLINYSMLTEHLHIKRLVLPQPFPFLAAQQQMLILPGKAQSSEGFFLADPDFCGGGGIWRYNSTLTF